MSVSAVNSGKIQLKTPVNVSSAMERVLIISQDAEITDSMQREISHSGYDCVIVPMDDVQTVINRQPPHLILVDSSRQLDTSVWESILDLKKQKKLPVMALIAAENIAGLDDYPEIDDFIIYPYDETELFQRVKRLLLKNGESNSDEIIRCDGLTIDLVTCEVTVDGKKADLTYKEYELLKLMSGHRGRVFTREALLDKIWGYDYYGGDPTVDVHMRRLRSKN